MRVLENIKFMPVKNAHDEVVSYLSVLTVEVSGEQFSATRVMERAEYDGTYPMLRDFIHDTLRNDVMLAIRRKLFEGATNAS